MSFTAEEVDELRKLLEIERIRKVLQLYTHFMDSREWGGLSGLFTEDALCEWGPYGTHRGRKNIHDDLLTGHAGRLPYDGLHITTNPWIELTGRDAAVSRTYLLDMWPPPGLGPISHPGYPENPVVLYAIYDNDYKRIGGAWQISRSAINFIWPERVIHEGFPRKMPQAPIG